MSFVAEGLGLGYPFILQRSRKIYMRLWKPWLICWSGHSGGIDCDVNSIFVVSVRIFTLQWRHNGPDGVSNHQPQACLLNRLFMRRSNKTSKVRVTGLCLGIHRWPEHTMVLFTSLARKTWWQFKMCSLGSLRLSTRTPIVKLLCCERHRDRWLYVNIGSCCGLMPPGNKPLPGPIFDPDPRRYMGHLDHNGFVAHATATCLDEFKGPLHGDMGLPTSWYPFLVGALDCH